MKPPYLSLFLFPLLFSSPLSAQAAAPEKALKYHEALLKRPQNSTLLDRFFGAWIDEQPIEALDAFLKERAEKNGGQDLAILAQHQLRRGQEDEALQTLGKAIAALPEESYLSMERAKIQLRRLDFETARTDLEKVTQGKDPQLTLEATKLIGKSWLREGNSKKAIETWDKLLAANPGDEDLLEDLVESAAAEGEIEQALSYTKKLIEASADPYKKTLRQLREGDLLAQAGRNDDAVKKYSDTLAQVGEGSWLEREILAQIDKAFRKQDRLNDLKTTFIELADANPRRLLIHRQLAKLEADQGDVDSAVGRFREVLKRSPGNQELREEFIRLLTDSEKFEDATEEINKLITQSPDSTSLLLQLADLQHRQNKKEANSETLEKALKLFGPDEISGIRIASLMFQYGHEKRGEEILKDLSAAENATTSPAEALASQYARTNRKAEAIDIFKKIGTDENLDVVLRAAGSISALGESNTAFDLLAQKIESHDQDPRFLSAISQAALAANKNEEAIKHSIRLVRLSKLTNDIAQSIQLAMRAITAADQSAKWQETFEKQESKTPAEICLLAALAESNGDFDQVEKLMAENTDPVVIRFHVVILERRGQWNEAIAVLTRLADTDEGRKASYFKDLSELQRNAGLTKDALATIESWKQSAPSDKTAWIVGSSILRENAQTDEAVKMIRQAVSRFKEDIDLTANLAQLHEEAGQLPEALSIYWQLYDSSDKPAEQARWATNLAKIATQTGRTQELEEQLRERARNNRRSIGPLLAQAELARLTRNEDRRRDLLLEAVRLQPNNIDLRLQIANLEEQSGNPDRVIAILEEAVATDTTGRIRSSLAQAYLRQGQILKGMRELQKLAGAQGNDPRAIESNAASLASSGLYDEAIRYMRESLLDGGDWRTKYLLATMLEQDGRESEAIPLFQSLLQATEEIPSLAAKNNLNRNTRGEEYWDQFPSAMKDIMQLMAASQAAYLHRNTDRNNYGFYSSGNGMSQVGIFMLPEEIKVAHSFAKIHLAKINPKGIENAEFINDLVSSGNVYEPDFQLLLKKYADYPGLFELSLAYSSWNEVSNMDIELLRNQLANNKTLTNSSRFQIYVHLIRDAKPIDPIWTDMVKVADEIAKNDKPAEAIQLGYMLIQLLNAKDETAIEFPEDTRKLLSNILIEIASKDVSDHDPMGNFKLIAIYCAGTQEKWIETVNETVKSYRAEKKPKQAVSLRSTNYSYSNYGYNNRSSSPFNLPQINTLSFRSLPAEVIAMIQPANSEENYYGFEMPDPKKLITNLDKFESLALRAWIATRAEDDAVIENALKAKPSDEESADFKTLQAFNAITKKDYPTAYKLFSELRPVYSSDRNLINWLNLSLIAIANEMKAEERSNLTEELQALLIQCRAHLGLQGSAALAAQAEKFGMTDLAKRFVPKVLKNINTGTARLGPASFSPNNPSSSSSGGNASIDKMKKFAADGKLEAAGLEALNLVRKANKATYNRSYEIDEIKENITPEVTNELLKISNPGETNSLTKLLEYADICSDFGKRDIALQVLTKLNKERPDDLKITGKLAFLLPADQRELAVKLVGMSATKDEFVDIAVATAQNLNESEDTTAKLNFFSIIATWLQSADPKQLENANLSWVGYHTLSFFEGDYNEDFPGLIDERSEKFKTTKVYTEYVETAKRLATAMLRHPAISEEGFRLLGVSNAWKIEDIQRDEQARQHFLNINIKPKSRNLGYGGYDDSAYFSIATSNYSSNASNQLEKYSSVSWISERIAAAKSPNEILPTSYLKELHEKNNVVGELVAALSNLKTIKQLEAYWKSDNLKNTSGPFISMCREAILARARHIPESSDFFADRINELTPKAIQEARYNSSHPITSLFGAALISASSHKDPTVLTKTCNVISNKIFGDKIDLSSAKNSRKTYEAISFFEDVIEESNFEPIDTIRIHNALYQLGIPAGRYSHQIAQSFSKVNLKNVDEAVKAFTSYGWLNDIDTWQSFSAIIVESNHSNNQINFIRKDEFMIPEAINYMNINISSDVIISHLEKLKPQTFGSLITAACFSSGNKRNELTEKAFNLASKNLTNISSERAKSFNSLLPWLPDSAIEKLPDTFKESIGKSKSEKLVKLNQLADEYLNNNPQTQSYGNIMYQSRDLVTQLAPLDLEKAVSVFLEAEKRYTESLSRGGSVSSHTSNGIQITERDSVLNDLLYNRDSQVSTDPKLAISFLTSISKSDAATRFNFSPHYSGYNSINYQIGQRIFQNANTNKKSDPKNPNWLIAMQYAAAFPQETSKEAYATIATYFVTDNLIQNSIRLPQDRTALAEMKIEPEFIALRQLTIGIKAWKNDTPQNKKITKDVLFSILQDSEISQPSRFQLIASIAQEIPESLEDPEFTEEFAKQFEAYALGERSCINAMCMQIIERIGIINISDQTQPFIKRINDAFWLNANSPKTGGHSNIPTDSGSSLFISAANVNDDVTARKLLNVARPQLEGCIATISTLISKGNHTLAKELMASRARPYIRHTSKPIPPYDLHFEKQLEAFRKTPGIDPVNLLLYEYQLKGNGPMETGKNAPIENETQREQRLAKAYKENPLTNRIEKVNSLASLTRDSHTLAILLRDEVIALRDELNIDNALNDWQSGASNPLPGVPATYMASGECVMFRQAAFLQFLDGDLSALDSLAETIAKRKPYGGSSSRNGDRRYVGDYLERILESAPMWICEAVHLNQTKGFDQAFETFAKFSKICDDRKELSRWAAELPLTIAEFFAYWNNDGKSFDSLLDQMKCDQKLIKSHRDRKGTLQFSKMGNQNILWTNPSFQPARKSFLTTISTRPEMKDYFGHLQFWLPSSAKDGKLEDAFLEFAENPPEGISPTIYTHILNFRAEHEFKQQKFDEGVSYAIKAIEVCPIDGPWKDIHFRFCAALIDRLIKAKNIDQAQKVHSMIKTETLNPTQTKRFNEFTKKLEPAAK